MNQSFKDLLSHYPRLVLADPADNDEILDFLDQISMTTERGQITTNRRPDFFKLCELQGETFRVVLMRNDDQSIGGLGVLSLFPMLIQGEKRLIGYTSDLRISPQMSRKTRVQFHKWYAEFAGRCAELTEFEGSPYLITSIFDENEAAKKSLVESKAQKNREPYYHPVFSYQNVNVMGRLPIWQKSPLHCECADDSDHEALLDFLTSNPQEAQFVWSREEALRKLKLLNKSLSDFLIIRNQAGEITACTLPVSDQAYRKMIVKNLSLPTKVFGKLLPLFGRPLIKDEEPLNTAYLGFLKIKSQAPMEKCKAIQCFLQHLFDMQKKMKLRDRFHSVTFFAGQKDGLEGLLRKKGYLCLTLPATIYQVVNRSYSQPTTWLKTSEKNAPDFEVSCL